MKFTRTIALSLALLFLLTPLLSVMGEPAGSLYVDVDLLAGEEWLSQPEVDCTPSGSGLRIKTLNANAEIAIPLDVWVDVTQSQHLGLTISGMPIGTEWDWMLDYHDSTGITGTVSARADYNLDGWYGNYNTTFQISGHFNWRKNNVASCADLDMANIKFTELRFYINAPAGTEFTLACLVLGSQSPIADVYAGSNSWARTEIEAADRAGMIPADLLKNYQGSITREDFCRLAIQYIECQTNLTIAQHMARKGVSLAAPFVDCSRTEVLAAAALGIVEGIGSNRFNPNGVISRAEAAVMLANTCAALGVDITTSPQTAYNDQSAIRSWARDEINFVSAQEIMTGNNNAFMPEDAYQTQQAFITFYRIIENVSFGELYDITDPKEIASVLWEAPYQDSVFTSAAVVTGFDAYRNRELSQSLPGGVGRDDVKYILHTQSHARLVNYADGYAITLPKPFEIDFSRSALRSRVEGNDYILNISQETTPYSNKASDWNAYLADWIEPCLTDKHLLSVNKLTTTRNKQVNTTILPGYTVNVYSIKIDKRDAVEYPYYNIALVRANNDYTNYLMLHYKSKTLDNARFDAILASLKSFTAVGYAQNDTTPYELVLPSNWNAETKAYYQKLMGQSTVDWGFMTNSLPIDSAYSSNWKYEIEVNQRLFRDTLSIEPDIMPTYNHLYFGGTVRYGFPNKAAQDFAGGNGFNGKPVLQFTYQFTTNNNDVNDSTPMFDILNGKFDEDFRLLAREIKAYGMPVLFRLNNEMDSTWTSYSAFANLLDTDIFAWSWERLYTIFEEEGVDNCIWVFHPCAVSSPPTSWGEWLNYLPYDMRMVHMLGVGDYEMGNGTSMKSFQTSCREQYKRVMPYFDNFPWGIGEFACGTGGEKRQIWVNGASAWEDTVMYRNMDKQAEWVDAMFRVMNNLDNPAYAFAKRIKYAVWFSANDYVTISGKSYVTNQLKLTTQHTATLAAFMRGFA